MGGGGSKVVIPQKPTFAEVYRMGDGIGKGAFSEVLTCNLRVDQTLYAVKVINKNLLTKEDKLSLYTEIAILSDIKHANVIQLQEYFDEDDTMYLVTEFVQGGELFDRIVRKEKYNEKDARGLVKVLLETMVYVHAKGIVHRDLKPENLLLMSEENDMDVKLCDFGLAKRLEDMTDQELACGTPGYVAPEILSGKSYGTEVDIWSIGVITYILVAGYPPFYDEDQKKLFKKIKKAQYSFHEEHWANKSDMVKDMIRNMICKDQKKRWTAAQLLEHPWMQIDDEILASNSLSGSQETLKRFNARRRFRAATQAIILTNRIRMLTGAIIRELDSESSEFKKGVSAVFIEDGAGVPEDESAVIDEGGDDTTHTTFFDSENSESTENRNRSSSATNQADIDDLFTDRPPTWITKGGSTTSTPLVEEESTSNPTDITSNIPSVVVEGTPASEIGAEVEAKSSAPILAVETEA